MKTFPAYDQEALTSLYAAADFMACNDIPTDSVMAAIKLIESKPVRFKMSHGQDGDVRMSRAS